MAAQYPEDPTNAIHHEQNSDTIDGFRKYLKKSFSNLSCVRSSKRKEEKPIDELTSKEPLDVIDNDKEQKQCPGEFNWNDNKYDFSHPRRGLAIIINNEDFRECKSLDNRKGSDKDASALYNCFRLLGFDVSRHDNLKGYEMVDVLHAAAKYYNHGASDCFACAVLTHGNDSVAPVQEGPSAKEHLDILYGTDGIPVSTQHLLEKVNDTNCPDLKNKPRLFFLQACRGTKCDDGQTILVKKSKPENPSHLGLEDGKGAIAKKRDLMVNLQEEASSSDDKPLQNPPLDVRDVVEDDDDENNAEGEPSKDPLPRPSPLEKDFLIMYATPSGYIAWRNESDGSWFIQTLCKVLTDACLTSTSLRSTLTKVINTVATEYESNSSECKKKKGLPVVSSQLCKDIYFNTNPLLPNAPDDTLQKVDAKIAN